MSTATCCLNAVGVDYALFEQHVRLRQYLYPFLPRPIKILILFFLGHRKARQESEGNILTDTSDDGIEIRYSSNCNVTSNELRGYHTAGIWQYFSSDCYIINNTVFGVPFPIYVQHSHDSFVIDNAIFESSNGIMLESSEKIDVTRNSVTDCNRGISI